MKQILSKDIYKKRKREREKLDCRLSKDKNNAAFQNVFLQIVEQEALEPSEIVYAMETRQEPKN